MIENFMFSLFFLFYDMMALLFLLVKISLRILSDNYANELIYVLFLIRHYLVKMVRYISTCFFYDSSYFVGKKIQGAF